MRDSGSCDPGSNPGGATTLMIYALNLLSEALNSIYGTIELFLVAQQSL